MSKITTITKIVTVNEDYLAVASNLDGIKIYDSDPPDLLLDENVFKLISIKVLKYYPQIVNYQLISKYKTNLSLLLEMKAKIISYGDIADSRERISKVIEAMLEYKNSLDNNCKFNRFNFKRDCYLLYLTAYNDILIQSGPLTFGELTCKIKHYKNLCRTKINPALALQALISVAALINDNVSATISLPDQI